MQQTHTPEMLTEGAFSRGLTYLGERDPDLGRVISQFGPPPFWVRDPGFPTLVHIVLEQQVSLASARAAFERLLEAAVPLTPESFLSFNDAALKRFGFSRQKTAYCRGIVRAIQTRDLDLDELATKDDDAVRAELTNIKGIGPWTAEIYLLMALRRPDAWPVGDLALAAALQELKGLSSRPGPDELEAAGDHWRPWRAVAARILWHFYLSRE